MTKDYTAVLTQRFCPRRIGMFVMMLAVCLGGCQTTAKPLRQGKNTYADEICRLDSADAGAEVEARTKQGNWRFLACFIDEPEAMNVPGLTSEEGMEFIDSGFFETEVFFDQRTLYVFQFEGDPKPWIDAKWRYAEKVNRALVKKIRETGRISALITGPTPSTKSVNK